MHGFAADLALYSEVVHRFLVRRATQEPLERRFRSRYSEAEREAVLERALQPYIAKGWQVDDRFGCTAVISKEWGPGYLLYGLAGNMMKDRERRAPQKVFKRRDLTVDELGDVRVTRAPSRKEGVSRYEH